MADIDATHERMAREDDVQGSSNRAFGLTFAGVFLLIACWPLVRGRPVRWWALVVAVLFFAAALLAPRTLHLLNRLWFAIGMVLHRIAHPVVMALLFFTTITPLAVLMRALGKDPLRLRRDLSASTYWIDRRPPGPAPNTMIRQF